MRRLIINADDFGLTSGVNRGVVEAHKHGVVTSATLMANGQAFEQAIALAHAQPRLGVGCHIVLVDGAPLLEQTADPRLLYQRCIAGWPHFREGISRFGVRALLRQLDENEIEAEATAQI